MSRAHEEEKASARNSENKTAYISEKTAHIACTIGLGSNASAQLPTVGNRKRNALGEEAVRRGQFVLF